MNATHNTSSDFVALVNQLHQSPYNPALKQAVVRRLPEMLAYAQCNPMALFRLAQIYPPNSCQYKQMMRRSAQRGCTNAMLAMCELLLKSNNNEDLELASQYMVMIENSNDSYIIESSRTILANHPRKRSKSVARVSNVLIN
jgi:hypothetical protein